MTPRIRPAASADAVAVYALQQAILGEGRWFLAEPDEGPDVELLRRRILDPRGVAEVALLGPRLVGFGLILPGPLRRTAHVGHLELFLAAGLRGQGLGRALLDALLGAARAHGGLRKVALAVRADNPAANRLYERVGFVEEGRRSGEIADGERVADDRLLALWL